MTEFKLLRCLYDENFELGRIQKDFILFEKSIIFNLNAIDIIFNSMLFIRLAFVFTPDSSISRIYLRNTNEYGLGLYKNFNFDVNFNPLDYDDIEIILKCGRDLMDKNIITDKTFLEKFNDIKI